MTFQNKLFLQLLVIALALVTVFPYSGIRYTTTAFEDIEAQREQAQITQFKQQFARFGDEVVRRVESIANAEATLRMAMDLARPKADKSLYKHDAIGAAQDRNLDVLEIAAWDGTIISSTPDYSRVGRNNALVSARMDWSDSPAFLDKQQLPDGDALLLLAVRPNGVPGKRIYIIGGCRIDQNFLSSFVPANMRVLLYRNFSESTFEPTDLLDRTGVERQAQRFAPLIQQVQRRKQPVPQTFEWSDQSTSAEAFYALPLFGRRNDVLAIFLVGSSRRELVLRTRRTEWFAAGSAAAAFVAALPICFWLSSRVSRRRGQTT
jgi:hypothetical protein